MPKMSWCQVDAAVIRLCGGCESRIRIFGHRRMRDLWRSARPRCLLPSRPGLARHSSRNILRCNRLAVVTKVHAGDDGSKFLYFLIPLTIPSAYFEAAIYG